MRTAFSAFLDKSADWDWNLIITATLGLLVFGMLTAAIVVAFTCPTCTV